MIVIPAMHRLDSDFRARVEAFIDRLIDQPPPGAREMIVARLPQLMKSLKANPSPLRNSIIKLAKRFFDLYVAEIRMASKGGQPRKTSKALRVATAALYYLCEVDDVIPDYEPNGFDDDVYALNYCAAKLRQTCSAWYQKTSEDFS